MSAHSSDPELELPGATAAEREALAWCSRQIRGLSAEEDDQFQAWLAAEPEHARLFEEMGGTWALLGESLEEPALVTPAPVSFWRRPSALRFTASLAAAAALVAIAYMGWWRPAHYSGETLTEIGGLRILKLPDGSTITLNTDSAVSSSFSPTERRVTLERGEAHFQVAKNPNRPFYVDAGGVSVRAVGTAFNVRLETKTVQVLVTEGRVRVNDTVSGQSLLAASAAADPLGEPELLLSGQKVTLIRPESPSLEPAKAAATIVVPAEIKRELAWQESRLDFVSSPLSEIVAEFNRYNKHQLVISDQALADQLFGGSFKPTDQAGFVRMLQENFPIVVTEHEDSTLLRSGR